MIIGAISFHRTIFADRKTHLGDQIDSAEGNLGSKKSFFYHSKHCCQILIDYPSIFIVMIVC